MTRIKVRDGQGEQISTLQDISAHPLKTEDFFAPIRFDEVKSRDEPESRPTVIRSREALYETSASSRCCLLSQDD